MPLCLFSDLSERERARRENNWLSRNYHGIEWFDDKANLKYFTTTLQLRELHGKHATYIPEDKKRLIICMIHSPEMYIICKEFLHYSKSCVMAKWMDNVVLITDFELKQNFFARSFLRTFNAYKLKSYKIAATRATIRIFSTKIGMAKVVRTKWDQTAEFFSITNLNFDVTRNIEA